MSLSPQKPKKSKILVNRKTTVQPEPNFSLKLRYNSQTKRQIEQKIKTEISEELRLIRIETQKIRKIKLEYQKLSEKLKEEINLFNIQKEKDLESFTKWKNKYQTYSTNQPIPSSKALHLRNQSSSTSNSQHYQTNYSTFTTISTHNVNNININGLKVHSNNDNANITSNNNHNNNNTSISGLNCTQISNCNRNKEIISLQTQLASAKKELKKQDNINKIIMESLSNQLKLAQSKIEQLKKQKHNPNNSNNNNHHNHTPIKNKKQKLVLQRNPSFKESKPSSSIGKTENSERIPKHNYEYSTIDEFHIINNINTLSRDHSSKNSIKLKKKLNTKTISSKHNNQHLSTLNNNTNIYDMTIPYKYSSKLDCDKIDKKSIINNDTIITYSNGREETIYNSGIRKITFDDNYQLIYFPNGDFKQIYPNNEKIIYYYDKYKVSMMLYGNDDGVKIYKYPNGKIIKEYEDGKKEHIENNWKEKENEEEEIEKEFRMIDNELIVHGGDKKLMKLLSDKKEVLVKSKVKAIIGESTN